ncbi:AraC family transcriptional regulator [Sporomusa sp. KB1]|jgi:AraC-like DNA-binding protein|uniref:AraC family transcriptional regulator n=1 Tax=Sporomusa sp. KB1 TaxID=943346 RepID=UPI0011ADF027|nr:AraC family transcriptional regulator [Sporomusa sp. KB1]TWH47755.1 AraC-like DNA-binding protein [Sporomusa sp. KB1]
MNILNKTFSLNNGQFIFQHNFTPRPVKSEFNLHIHKCYELYYFISGNVPFYIEGQQYAVQSGDFLIINSKELHRACIAEEQPYERIVMFCKPEYVNFLNTASYNLFDCFERRKLGYFNITERSKVLKYQIDKQIIAIEEQFKTGAIDSEIMIFSIFVQLLVKLNQIYLHENALQVYSQGRDTSKTQAILNYINDNLSTKITLDLLQQEFYISKYYLCRIFKQSTGFGVYEYITYKRLLRAKELLCEGISASEVAHHVGFENYSNFYRLFKKVYGFSPKKIKDEQHEDWRI